MRFTDSRGRKVLDTSSATTVGKVDALLVDPAERRVVAVKVKRKGDDDVLLWPALTSFGPDAVTVGGEDAFSQADDRLDALASKAGRLLGKRVLTDAGNEAGTVQDVEFDPEDGRVTVLVTTEGDVDGARLRGVGSWAVVVARP